jgi:hypothetical protein
MTISRKHVQGIRRTCGCWSAYSHAWNTGLRLAEIVKSCVVTLNENRGYESKIRTKCYFLKMYRVPSLK